MGSVADETIVSGTTPVWSGHVTAFDFVRGLGSHLVVLCHLSAHFLDNDQITTSSIAAATYSVARYALLGFFIISGFVIAHSLYGHTGPAGFNERRFFVRRAARIFPPLVFVLGLELVINGLITAGIWAGYNADFDYRSAFNFQSHLLYPLAVAGTVLGYNGPTGWNPMPLNTPLWTLGYELWFYWASMLVFTFWYGSDRQASRSLVPIGLVLAIVLFSRNLNFLFLATIWMYGFIGYALVYRSGLSAAKLRVLFSVLFFGMVIALAIQTARDPYFAVPDETYRGFMAQVLICIPIACVLSLLSLPAANPAQSALVRLVKTMADHSYTIYVIHMPVMVLVSYLMGPVLASVDGRAVIAITGCYVLIVFAAQRLAIVLEDSSRYIKTTESVLAALRIDPLSGSEDRRRD